MDELEISGKRYISTRRAGKEHKYHSDYIGQLIRGGKVKGQKVGRSWYVDEASLASYLGKEASKAEVNVPLETPPMVQKKVMKESAPEGHERVTSWKKIPEVTTKEVFVKEVEEEERQVPVIVEESVPAPIEYLVEEKIDEEVVNQIPIHTPEKEEKKKNITYVTDEAPVFPVKMRKNKIEKSVEEVEESSVVDEKEIKVVRPLHYGAVAMLGVLAFIVVGGMSYLLSYKTTVEGDQMSASITLSE